MAAVPPTEAFELLLAPPYDIPPSPMLIELPPLATMPLLRPPPLGDELIWLSALSLELQAPIVNGATNRTRRQARTPAAAREWPARARVRA